MKVIRVHRPGGPEVLEIEELPGPEPRAGWVRIRVRAFGLNRSEMYTRQGHSPSVQFPRVLGIECVGVVDDAGGTDLPIGQTVAALRYRPNIERRFRFDEIVTAHRFMEENRGSGKLVVVNA